MKRRRLRKDRVSLLIAIALGVILTILWLCGVFSSRNKFPTANKSIKVDTVLTHARKVDLIFSKPRENVQLKGANGKPINTPIIGIDDYNAAFPDMNDVQLATAKRLGISEIEDREEAAKRKKELVYMGSSPLYRVEHLAHSVPYLTPRAQRLLNEISLCFIDSLQRKGLPFYRPIVTSVLRTKKDVERLRRVNPNASANSCHQYGTTFDICYNSFWKVIDPDDHSKKQVWDGKLKEVLGEVLRDQRKRGTCYIRYEAHQACFHITAR